MTNSNAALEKAAETFSQSHAKLAETVRELQMRIAAQSQQARPQIRALADVAANARADLAAQIEAAPEAFIKPRTRKISGVKIGFRKMAGRVTFVDEHKVIERIRAHLPKEQSYMLIRVRETVDKTALSDLELSDLRRLGVSLSADEDQVVIDPGDKELDRFLAELIKKSGDDDAPRAA